ncbi:TRAP transporter large permease [uncultured Cohaesibacter sp.]|uniref:TRAP transporter large permease n=1 Tax=uncultured Cohaesibacter sp. TaxID=1002546 RepID=UPI0029C729BF|nr:TRAP transporter large permease [uncultured Cohaesibacter sp.]
MDIFGFTVLFLFLLAVGMPIAFVMLASSTAYFLLSGNPVFLRMLPERMMNGVDAFVLMAIPFFLLTGEIMNRAQLTDRLFHFCNMIIGRVRGGLAQVNVLASVMFSGVTGVALGDVAALGKMFIPAMERQGYDRGFTAAVTAASSLIGAIIPPSTMIIVYCATMNVSVGAMFMASLLPGLALGVLQMGTVQFLAWKRQYPKVEVEVSPRGLVIGFRDAFFAILLPVIMIRGIALGWFTPTEAAAATVVYSLVIGLFFLRTLKIGQLPSILTTATLDSARLFLIIAGASAVSWVFAMEQLPITVQHLFAGLSDNTVVIVIVLIGFFLFLGLWLDPSIAIILFGPVALPLAVKAGLHPVQFGIFVITSCVIGTLTPPVGNVIFAVSNISNLGIGQLGRALIPFLIGGVAVLLLICFLPDLTLMLPRRAGLIQ